jgi:TPR repeat protein
MYNVGVLYETGTGVAADICEAVKWYTRSAEAGDADAQVNLGACYEMGEGVAADAREAVKWYTRAAEAGDANAQHNLGACYADGIGVARDLTAARSWFARAAAAGFPPATAALTLLDALPALIAAWREAFAAPVMRPREKAMVSAWVKRSRRCLVYRFKWCRSRPHKAAHPNRL